MTDTFDRLKTALADGYTIVEEVGAGGMATVYLAEDIKHHRKVAVKVLRPELAAALGPERFLREIEIAARLTHPHILPLFDSGEADGFLYYVMPFVEGESLRDRINREKQLPVEDALQIARNVAAALSYAHSHDVIHRDVKPENILLSGGEAVVADFGIARAVSAAGGEKITDAGIAVGTPVYMSPEQGTGSSDIDARSDVYSLACVVFEMLAGEPPFTGVSAQALVARHVSEKPPSLRVVRPSISQDLQTVVEKALDKVPADRFATAIRFAKALSRAHGRPTVSAAVRWWRNATIGALVLGGALGSWVLWSTIMGRNVSSPTTPGLDPTHVAVLYFDDNSEGQQALHIANGLTEGVIDELRRVGELVVSSPNAARAYSRKGIPLDSVARGLEVGTIIEGSVAQSGTRLRVTARLVNGATGDYLDSRTVTRDIGELFELQDDLVREVSQFLRRRLGVVLVAREHLHDTRSVKAWELVQRGEALLKEAKSLSPVGKSVVARMMLSEAESLAVRAEAFDRSWIQPILLQGWIAVAQAEMSDSDENGLDSAWIHVGERRAERVLRLQPDNAQALELRGTLRYRRWVGMGAVGRPEIAQSAERDLRAAVRFDESLARALSTLSTLLQTEGRFAEAKQMAQRAYSADAFLAETEEIVFRLYYTSLDLGEYEEAKQWCDEGHRRFSHNWLFAFCELTILQWPEISTPDVDRAWELVSELKNLTDNESRTAWLPRWHMMVAGVLARAKLADSARAVISRSRLEGEGDPEVTFHEATARLLLGERDGALQLLAAYLEAHPHLRRYVAANPVFGPLHEDKDFQVLISAPPATPPH